MAPMKTQKIFVTTYKSHVVTPKIAAIFAAVKTANLRSKIQCVLKLHTHCVTSNRVKCSPNSSQYVRRWREDANPDFCAVCCIFYDAVNILDYTHPRQEYWWMTDGKRFGTKMSKTDVLSQNLPGETEESHEKPNLGVRYLGRKLYN
jgi:hypothetical protein